MVLQGRRLPGGVPQMRFPALKLIGGHAEGDGGAARLRRALKQRDVHRAGGVAQGQRPAAASPVRQPGNGQQAKHAAVPGGGGQAVSNKNMQVVDSVEAGGHGVAGSLLGGLADGGSGRLSCTARLAAAWNTAAPVAAW